MRIYIKQSTAKKMTACALFAAISIVMARLLSFSTPDGVRWSADKFPLFLAGMLYGPLFGGLSGILLVACYSLALIRFCVHLQFCMVYLVVCSAGFWQRSLMCSAWGLPICALWSLARFCIRVAHWLISTLAERCVKVLYIISAHAVSSFPLCWL